MPEAGLLVVMQVGAGDLLSMLRADAAGLVLGALLDQNGRGRSSPDSSS